MKNFRLALTSLALVAAAAGLLVISHGATAAKSGGAGQRVSPVRSDLVIEPGGSKTVNVFVENITGHKATYKVIFNDFVARDESGAPALLLNGQSNDKHGLSRYMSAVDSVTVAAGKQKQVEVHVNIPKGTAGGGYYGVVRFAQQVAPGSNGQAANVSLSPSTGSIILVRVPGDVVEKMNLASFDAKKGGVSHVVFTSGKGIYASIRLQNEGNIQEQPFGKVILRHSGKAIETHEINPGDQPGNVLPDSIREFKVPLKKVSSFGKYQLEGSFGYGQSSQAITGKTTFYVIPLWLILIGVLVILVILFLIFGLPKIVRSYNRRVIRNASRRRR